MLSINQEYKGTQRELVVQIATQIYRTHGGKLPESDLLYLYRSQHPTEIAVLRASEEIFAIFWGDSPDYDDDNEDDSPQKESTKWHRYRFKTRSADVRPIIFNTAYPYWISGEDAEGNAIILAYLPDTEPLSKYWDDAFDITLQIEESVRFTARFPKPGWYEPASS